MGEELERVVGDKVGNLRLLGDNVFVTLGVGAELGSDEGDPVEMFAKVVGI